MSTMCVTQVQHRTRKPRKESPEFATLSAWNFPQPSVSPPRIITPPMSVARPQAPVPPSSTSSWISASHFAPMPRASCSDWETVALTPDEATPRKGINHHADAVDAHDSARPSGLSSLPFGPSILTESPRVSGLSSLPSGPSIAWEEHPSFDTTVDTHSPEPHPNPSPRPRQTRKRVESYGWTDMASQILAFADVKPRRAPSPPTGSRGGTPNAVLPSSARSSEWLDTDSSHSTEKAVASTGREPERSPLASNAVPVTSDTVASSLGNARRFLTTSVVGSNTSSLSQSSISACAVRDTKADRLPRPVASGINQASSSPSSSFRSNANYSEATNIVESGVSYFLQSSISACAERETKRKNRRMAGEEPRLTEFLIDDAGSSSSKSKDGKHPLEGRLGQVVVVDGQPFFRLYKLGAKVSFEDVAIDGPKSTVQKKEKTFVSGRF